MKRRVRGLLHRKWLGPLGALALAALPMLVVGALVTLLMPPLSDGLLSLKDQLLAVFSEGTDTLRSMVVLLFSFQFDFTEIVAAMPGQAILFAVFLFVSLPVSVSVSGFFLSFLRGKKPSPLEVFSCFSGRYPRALGGMLYMLLWTLLWALMAFVAPLAIYNGGIKIIEIFAEQLAMYQMYIYGGLIGLSLIWFVVFTMLFINRMLAYVLTPVCIAAQPRLPAFRAVRLSRKLMRGCKWRLIGLCLSFLNYYLPAIIAGVLLVVMRYLGSVLSLTEILQQSIRLFLWIVIFANQLVLVYVAPYMAACFRAFFIERKREALMDEEVTPDDFAPKMKKDYHVTE